MLLIPIVACLVATLVTTALLPVVGRVRVRPLLHRSGDDVRRPGAPLVPRVGGVALMAGTVAGVLTALAMRGAGAPVPTAWLEFAPLLVAAVAIVFVLGLVDDLRGVRPAGKLAVQLVAAVLAWLAGVRIESVAFPPDITLSLGPLAFPVTILWLVGATNALNLVDGLDGLAATVTLSALLGVVGAAVALNNNGVVLLAIVLAGSTAAFLRANWHPARIFLGDSGALAIGFMLAIATVESARRTNGAVVMLVPALALAYPILDTTVAILRRWLRGEPLARADGRHVHHQLVALGYGQPEAVRIIGLFSALMTALALAVAFARPAVGIVVALAVMAVLGGTVAWGLRWLQYDEFAEAGSAVLQVARLGRNRLRFAIIARDIQRRIEGSPDIAQLDALLRASAPALGVVDMYLCRESARRRVALSDALSHADAAQAYRVDMPVLDLHDAEPADPVVLRVYGAPPHANAERAAWLLAPAVRMRLAFWDAEHVKGFLPHQRGERRSVTPSVTA